jgi:hypothetical protein
MMLPEIGQKMRIIYSGINPSFHEPFVKSVAKTVECPLEYFNWSRVIEESEVDRRRPQLQAFETEARIKYTRYFRHFEKFSCDIGVSHESTTHIDVLGIRATSQKQMIKTLHALRKDQQVLNFIEAQRSLYVEILQLLSPEIVLVANARAARWIRDDLSLIASPDKRIYRCQDVPNTTFVLSGQLGGGVTDEFARDRLVADVKAILKKPNGQATAESTALQGHR